VARSSDVMFGALFRNGDTGEKFFVIDGDLAGYESFAKGAD
jgi:hypothetical protein